MGNSLRSLLLKFDYLTDRERLLIFLVSLVFVYTLGTALIANVKQKIPIQETKIKNWQLSLDSVEQQIVVLRQGSESEKREQIRQALANLYQQHERMIDLVSPGDMVGLVKQVLGQGSGLKLLRLESIAPVPLEISVEVKQSPGLRSAKSEKITMYKHGMFLEFTGKYADFLSYLENMESQQKRFIWDSASIQIREYPVSVFSLRLFTISRDRDLIRV